MSGIKEKPSIVRMISLSHYTKFIHKQYYMKWGREAKVGYIFIRSEY